MPETNVSVKSSDSVLSKISLPEPRRKKLYENFIHYSVLDLDATFYRLVLCRRNILEKISNSNLLGIHGNGIGILRYMWRLLDTGNVAKKPNNCTRNGLVHIVHNLNGAYWIIFQGRFKHMQLDRCISRWAGSNIFIYIMIYIQKLHRKIWKNSKCDF